MTGNLGDPELGLSKDVWEELSQSVDIVIHNGALVHWVYARDFVACILACILANAFQIPVFDT